MPGLAGVKVTACVHCCPAIKLAPEQVPLEPATKSRPEAPAVSTRTVFTVPTFVAVTLTLREAEEPTPCGPKFVCAGSNPPAAKTPASALTVFRRVLRHLAGRLVPPGLRLAGGTGSLAEAEKKSAE